MQDKTKPISTDLNRVQLLIKSETIELRAREIVLRLREILQFKPENRPPLFISIAEGGLPWGDLICKEWRALTGTDHAPEVIHASSYVGTKSTGVVSFSIPERVRARIEHETFQTIVLLEDIVETGKTLDTIVHYIYGHAVVPTIICLPMLRKGKFGVRWDFASDVLDECSKRRYAMLPGFDIDESIFTLGFGMDLDGAYRSLPYIGQKV